MKYLPPKWSGMLTEGEEAVSSLGHLAIAALFSDVTQQFPPNTLRTLSTLEGQELLTSHSRLLNLPHHDL